MYAVNYSFYGYLLATDRLRKVFIQSDNDIDLNNLKYIDEVCESIHDVLRLDRERLNTFEHFYSARSFIHVIFAQYQGKDPLSSRIQIINAFPSVKSILVLVRMHSFN